MLCSVCNKNTAVVFVNKLEDGKKSVEGYCYNCAKEKGINPLEALAKNANISNSELEDMTTQIESLLKDFSENMNLESLGITPEDLETEIDAEYPTEHITEELIKETLQNINGEYSKYIR